MIKMVLKRKGKVRHAELSLDDAGGVRVRTGPSGRLREIHTPASLLNSSPAEFRDLRVSELMREGYHVVSAEHVEPTSSFSFESHCDGEAITALCGSLQQRGVPSDSGVLEVVAGSANALGKVRGVSIGRYGWQVAVAFALVGGNSTVIRDGHSGGANFTTVFDRIVPLTELTEPELETLYSNDVLRRPFQFGSFGARRHRARIAI